MDWRTKSESTKDTLQKPKQVKYKKLSFVVAFAGFPTYSTGLQHFGSTDVQRNIWRYGWTWMWHSCPSKPTNTNDDERLYLQIGRIIQPFNLMKDIIQPKEKQRKDFFFFKNKNYTHTVNMHSKKNESYSCKNGLYKLITNKQKNKHINTQSKKFYWDCIVNTWSMC